MPPALTVILILLALLILVVLGISLWIVKQALYPRKFSYEKSYLIEVENGRFSEDVWNSWEKHELIIQSPYGYNLSCTWLPQPGSKKTIILLHGFPYTRVGMIKYIPVFRSRGFNVLIYDQRYYGRSGGPFTSYGFFEKHDLKAALDWVLEHTGPASLVGTLGESMGGATVLQHGVIDPRPAFIIADSSYADLREAMQIRLRDQYHLPAFPITNIGARLLSIFGGFTPEQASAERAAAELTMPVLFIQSMNDVEVPPAHGRRLFAAKRKGLRRLYLAPDAGHVEAVWADRAAYDREVGEFLKEAGIM